jgi:hypothetical protein
MGKRYHRTPPAVWIETDEFRFEPSPFSLPFTSRLGQAMVVTAVLVVVMGASVWHRASLVSTSTPVAWMAFSAIVLAAFGISYLVLEKLECPSSRPLRQIRFSHDAIALVRQGRLERRRSLDDLALTTVDEKELTLLFDDGELIVAPRESFRTTEDFEKACTWSQPRPEPGSSLQTAA